MTGHIYFFLTIHLLRSSIYFSGKGVAKKMLLYFTPDFHVLLYVAKHLRSLFMHAP